MIRGKFIVFEGVDGAGKSTQVQMLHRAIPNSEVFIEPGETELGGKIRELLLHDNVEMCTKAQTMLFMASRAQLMHHIACKINQGITVILDRYSYSTYAYQQDLGLKEWIGLTDYVCPMGWPDVCFWLDVPEEIRIQRLKGKNLDRFERLGPDYYAKIVERYGILLSARPEMVRIDVGNDPASQIHHLIMKAYFRQ